MQEQVATAVSGLFLTADEQLDFLLKPVKRALSGVHLHFFTRLLVIVASDAAFEIAHQLFRI